MSSYTGPVHPARRYDDPDDPALPQKDEIVEVIIRWANRSWIVTGQFDSLELNMEPYEYPGVAGEKRFLPGPKTATIRLHSVQTRADAREIEP